MAKVLIANWKEHPLTAKEATTIAKASDAAGVVVCPPQVFIATVAKAVKKAQVGAQDGFYEPEGAFTGFVSMAQLAQNGVSYVIIGHSERRSHGEDDTVIAKKVAAAFEAGLTPVVCVGETREEHDGGKTKEVVDRQVRAAFSLMPAEQRDGARAAYIAYEPVWAISTNQKDPAHPVADTPQQSQTVVRYLEGIVRGMPITPKFLYGGSVNAQTVSDFLACPEFAGALVGAASLRTDEFKKMIAVAAKA